MLQRKWPNDSERRVVQEQINYCLKFVQERLKSKVTSPTYLRCVWIRNQLSTCQTALDAGVRKEVARLLAEIDWRIVELYKER